jgi:hypothetical protein
MIASRVILLLLVVSWPALFAGCGSSRRIELRVGVHHVTVRVPRGWERVDYGQRQVFQHGLARIVLADFGLVEPVGYLREIETAQDLWSRGQALDARDRLAKLRLLPASFASHDAYEAIWGATYDLRRTLEHGTPAEGEASFRDLIDALQRLPAPSVEDLADVALRVFGHDQRREIANKTHRQVGGREALVIDTWDRLSHEDRKRYVLAINEGSLLLAATEQGVFAEVEEAFDALVASIGLP